MEADADAHPRRTRCRHELDRRDLLPHTALDLFKEPETRRRLSDYAEIADELDFDGPAREAYPVERSLPTLTRVLTEWRDMAQDWLQSHADYEERMGASEAERAENRDDYRLDLWADCESILDRLAE